jgi:nucleotide-binding universal stress UspA family protein
MTHLQNKLVLVPTDFTEPADYATEHAAGVAKLLGYKVCLFHVINKETKSQLKKEGLKENAIDEKLAKKAKEAEEKYQVEVEHLAKDGSIFSSIGEVAKELGAEFLTMGTHGKVGIQNFIGSYAWKVVTSTPAPVIVVQKGARFKPYNNIIMNIDHTMESKHKVRWAVYIAKIFQSTVHLTFQAVTDEFLLRKTKNNLHQIKGILEKNNVKYIEKHFSDKGSKVSKLLEDYANSVSAELILVLTNKDKSTFILSPWAEQILFNDSKIPVMCINPIESHVSRFVPY